MLIQNDPISDFEYLFSRLGSRNPASRYLSMPIDAYQRGDDIWVHFDLPGVEPDSLDIDVERGVVTVTAERGWQTKDSDHLYISERPQGNYRRQVHLGDSLDAEKIEATFDAGVLTLRVPVAETAKPRKIAVASSSSSETSIDVEPTDGQT